MSKSSRRVWWWPLKSTSSYYSSQRAHGRELIAHADVKRCVCYRELESDGGDENSTQARAPSIAADAHTISQMPLRQTPCTLKAATRGHSQCILAACRARKAD